VKDISVTGVERAEVALKAVHRLAPQVLDLGRQVRTQIVIRPVGEEDEILPEIQLSSVGGGPIKQLAELPGGTSHRRPFSHCRFQATRFCLR